MVTLEELAKQLTETRTRLAAVEGKLTAMLAALGGGGGAVAGALPIASDADLDGDHGDPLIRGKDPKNWQGESFSGRHMSEASADYLDELAGLLEWKAKKEEADPAKSKYAKYSRADAARARGWARRKRNGWRDPEASRLPPAVVDDPFASRGDAFEPTDDTLPF